MKPVRRTRHLAVESLENRQLLSVTGASQPVFDPSPLEQEMLEHMNRFRLAPMAELDVLFTDVATATARDPDARIAMGVFKDPSAEEIRSDWASLSPVAPLAWNTSLYTAATNHTKLMVVYDEQSHLLPGESSLGARLSAAGYQGSAVGENVFAYMNTVFHGHSAFAIDWGVADRSHRDNLMASMFREVGISIIAEDSAATQVGPLLVTEDFGDGSSLENPYLLGVVYDDTNGNGRYDAGEGYGGVELLIEGSNGTFTASSLSAGGYQTFVPPGVYTVTAYGGSLPSPMVIRDVAIGSDNVKVDFEYDPAQLLPLVDLNGPGEAGVDSQTTYFEGWGAVPVVAADARISGPTGDRPILSLTATITNHLNPQEYLAVDTTGTPIVADYDAPAGILTLSGSASAGQYQQVLRTLVYDQLGSNPDRTPREIEIVAFDGVQSGAPATATVNIVATVPPEVTIDDIRVEEGSAGALGGSFTVSLSAAVEWTVSVKFATGDDSARAGEDFQAVSQTVVFAPGETVQTVWVPLIDDELAEDDESFFGILSDPSGAVIADGVGVATIVDDDVAIELGAVDFLGIQGIELAAESPLYRLTTVRGGVLSIDVSAGADDDFVLTIYDRYRSPDAALSVASSDGHARIDLAGAAAGETYYVELSGAASAAEMLLGNVVHQDGAVVYIDGTSGNDMFEFLAGPSLWFSINGLEYEYTRGDVARVVFSGNAGVDRAELTGSAGDDVANLSPGRAELRGAGYELAVADCEVIRVDGGGGENDTASLFDSEGDDLLIGGPTSASLSGAGFENTAAGFQTVLAYSTSGGYDTAQLRGGAGDEEYVGKPDIGKLLAANSYLRVKFFEKTVVEGGGGVDSARIYGNSASETFTGGPRTGELVGDGYHMMVQDFPYIHAYSRGGTGDQATLTGSEGDDTLVVTPTYAKLFGAGYLVRAKFFPSVEIAAPQVGFKRARLYDSLGDDTAVLNFVESQLAGRGFYYRLRGFNEVIAYSDAGGSDTAKIYDTAGDDLFTGRPADAILSGGGFFGRAVRFEAVQAYSVAGGTDTAELYDSPGNDQLQSRPDFTWMDAGGYFIRAKFFDIVHSYSNLGGRDTARFYAGGIAPYFEGRATVSAVSESGKERVVNAFAAVYAEAAEPGGTALLLGSGTADDLFESGQDWTRVSNPVLDFSIEVRGFTVDLGETAAPPDETSGS